MNLLLIRKDTPQINFIINNLSSNTIYIILNEYDNSDKLIDKIKNKCQSNIIENIGLITLNNYTEHFYLCNFEKCILNNCQNYDPEIITWQPILSLLNYLKNQYNCYNFDMITCNIYNNANWRYVSECIYNKTSVQIRSSTNITGINGDWVLESHNINLIELYFKNNIINFNHNLDVEYNLNFVIDDNKIHMAGNDINGFVGFQNNIFKECDLPDNIVIKDFALGDNYTILLTTDNKVYGCGVNDIGQLGDGTLINKYKLVEMDLTPTNNVIIDKIYSAKYSTYILTENNTIFSCGSNNYGELGIGNIYNQSTLSLVNTSMINNAIITKISTGIGFFTVLTNDNKIYACGNNYLGQLGLLNIIYSEILTQMNMTNFNTDTYPIDVECGGDFTLVLSNDNNIYCCGYNNFGQLGNGNNINQPILTKININFIPKQISCGYFHSSILSTNNEIYFAGYNVYGQFGNNNTDNSNIFIKTELNNIIPTKISCGNFHTFLHTNNNLVYSTGNNLYGELGIKHNSNVKQFTLLNTNFIDISQNSIIKSGTANSFILSDSLYSCGYNKYSNLINNDYTAFSNTKLFESSTPKITNIKYGKNFIVLLTDDNKIYTSGLNLHHQLSIGNAINPNLLNEIYINIPDIYPIDIACGDEHFIVLMNNNKVYGCGRNDYGQLCQYDNILFNTLTLINTTHNIIDIDCGSYHSIFLTDNYKILACGRNIEGQLGNNTFVNSNILVETNLSLLGNIKPKQISCGSYHTVILTDNFTLYSCGLNTYGQLGISNNTNSNIIQLMKNNMGIDIPVAISCGSYHTTILTKSGKVYSCGLNSNGQLCNKSYNNSNELIEIYYDNINNNAKIISIFSKNSNTFIIDETKQLYSCGLDDNGQLGINVTSNYITNNLLIDTPSVPTSIYAGPYNSYVLSDKTLYSTGKNTFNQLNNNILFVESDNFTEFNLNNLQNISHIETGNENIYIINNNELYVCGKNSNGQNGNNTNEDSFELEKINLIEFVNDKPNKVFTFYEHTFVLTHNNKLYATGLNTYGQLGLGTNNNIYKFSLIDTSFIGSSIISNISCGKYHSVILTNDGKIFISGSNIYGQLGNGNNTNLNTFTLLDTFSLNGTPIQIACGAHHTLILTNTNKIYGTGLNNYGQLGINSTINSNTFIAMNIGSLIPTEIYCGYDWSLINISNNELYGCGRNFEGQLDITSANNIFIPQKIKTTLNNGENITQISCGFYHFFVLTSFNNLYAFGNNDCGQIGIYKNKSINQLHKSKLARTNNNVTIDFLNSNLATNKNLIYIILDITKLINEFNFSLEYIFEIVNIKDLSILGYSFKHLKNDGVTINIFINNDFTIRQLYEIDFTIQEILDTDKYTIFDLLNNFTKIELDNYKLISYSEDILITEPNDYYVILPNMNANIKDDVVLINRNISTVHIIANSIPFLSIKLYDELLNIDNSNFSIIKTKPINIKVDDFKNIFYYYFRIYSVGIAILNLLISKYKKRDIFNKFIDEYESKYNNLFTSLAFDKQISFYKELSNINNINFKKKIINSREFDNILKLTNPINNKYYLATELIYYSTVLEVGFKLQTDFIIYV